MSLWDSWGEIRRGFPQVQDSVLVEVPTGADQVFTDTVTEVYLEWEEREWARMIQETPIVRTETRRFTAGSPNLSNMPRTRVVPQRPLIESAPDWGLSSFASSIQRDIQHLQNQSQQILQQALAVDADALGLPTTPTEEDALGRRRRIGGGVAALTEEEMSAMRRSANFGLAYGMRPETVQASLTSVAERIRRNAEIAAQAVMPSDYSEVEMRAMAQTMGIDLSVSGLGTGLGGGPSRQVEDFAELEEGEVLDIVARTTTTKTRKAARAKTAKADPLYTWGLQSSKPRNGGEFITYEVRMEEDGSLRCNCPGWIFKKKDAERGCKHTREVEVEAKDFFQRNKRGEQLPTVAPSYEQTTRLKTNKKTESKIGAFGRIIDFDE